MPDLDHPVLIGVGQLADRSGDPTAALEPAESMAEAARRAEEDTSLAGILARVDSIRVVNMISWSYGDPGRALAARIGATPRESLYTTVGGNSPQMLVGTTADALGRGEIELALIAGAEAMQAHRAARRDRLTLEWAAPSGSPDEVIGDPRWGSQEEENRHGAAVPTQIYPLFENALRHRSGRSIEEHRRHLGALCARFSAIAAKNPHAWFEKARTSEEITSVTPANRMVSFPYPKFMNAVLDVNQAAAVLMTTVRTARELGVPEDRWVYPIGSAEAHDHWFFLERESLDASPALRQAGAAALEQAGLGIEDIAFFDLYSCFPCAPQIAAKALGIEEGDPRDWTVTGGLPYFGGPGSNYSLHAIATMADRLRAARDASGLVSAVGWYMTKHAIGVYSTRPPSQVWDRSPGHGLQDEIDRSPKVELALEPEGPATIETFTVVHDREGEPERGIIVGRLEDGRRFIANSPSERGALEALEAGEAVGGRVGPGPDGLNRWTPS